MRVFIIGLLWTLSACAAGASVTAMNAFADIAIGTSSTEVIERMGQPVSMRSLDDGSIEYEYTETISLGGRTLEERHYLILLKQGKVVSKQVKQTSPPGYLLNSYDMQTTQN